MSSQSPSVTSGGGSKSRYSYASHEVNNSDIDNRMLDPSVTSDSDSKSEHSCASQGIDYSDTADDETVDDFDTDLTLEVDEVEEKFMIWKTSTSCQ
jgi:hypothetical protein